MSDESDVKLERISDEEVAQLIKKLKSIPRHIEKAKTEDVIASLRQKQAILERHLLDIRFQSFDLDGNGVISCSELVEVLQLLNADAWPPEVAERLFAAADVNRDGKIQYSEFISWLSMDGTDPKAVRAAALGMAAAPAAMFADRSQDDAGSTAWHLYCKVVWIGDVVEDLGYRKREMYGKRATLHLLLSPDKQLWLLSSEKWTEEEVELSGSPDYECNTVTTGHRQETLKAGTYIDSRPDALRATWTGMLVNGAGRKLPVAEEEFDLSTFSEVAGSEPVSFAMLSSWMPALRHVVPRRGLHEEVQVEGSLEARPVAELTALLGEWCWYEDLKQGGTFHDFMGNNHTLTITAEGCIRYSKLYKEQQSSRPGVFKDIFKDKPGKFVTAKVDRSTRISYNDVMLSMCPGTNGGMSATTKMKKSHAAKTYVDIEWENGKLQQFDLSNFTRNGA